MPHSGVLSHSTSSVPSSSVTPSPTRRLSAQETGTKCPRCEKTVYAFEAITLAGAHWHQGCAKCKECNCSLTGKTVVSVKAEVYCKVHVPKVQSAKVAHKEISSVLLHSDQNKEVSEEVRENGISNGISNGEEAMVYVSAERFSQLESLVLSLQQKLSAIENLLTQQISWQYIPLTTTTAHTTHTSPLSTTSSITNANIPPKLTLHASFPSSSSSCSSSPPPIFDPRSPSLPRTLSEEEGTGGNPFVVSFTPESVLPDSQISSATYTYDTVPLRNNNNNNNNNIRNVVDQKNVIPTEFSSCFSSSFLAQDPPLPHSRKRANTITSTTTTTTTTPITTPLPTQATKHTYAAVVTKHSPCSSPVASSSSASSKSRSSSPSSSSPLTRPFAYQPRSTSFVRTTSTTTTTPTSPSSRAQSSKPPFHSTATSSTKPSSSSSSSAFTSANTEVSAEGYTTLCSSSMEPASLETQLSSSLSTPPLTSSSLPPPTPSPFPALPSRTPSPSPSLSPSSIPPSSSTTTTTTATTAATTANTSILPSFPSVVAASLPDAQMYNNYQTPDAYSASCVAESVPQVPQVPQSAPSSTHETKYAYTPSSSAATTTTTTTATTTTTTSMSSSLSSSVSSSAYVVPPVHVMPNVSAEEMLANERFQKWTHRTLELWQYFAKRNLDPVAQELEPYRLQLLKGVCGHPKDYLHFINGIPNNAWQDRYYAATAAMSQRGLLGISRDLYRAVTTRVRVILEETNVPLHKKTIRAISAGGVAGGTKFFDNNILFKFPNDPKISNGSFTMHLYGGAEPDLERAAKAASNDLKGANALSNCWWNAFMPMAIMPQILVDYMGYRIIAMTWVDMSGAVLVSGSRDGGQTVVDEDEIARAALKYAAYHLHLAKHKVNGVDLYAAGDIEVHKNSDGRRYVLDLARTFPPEDPEESSHLPYVPSSIFFRMHRPSFLTHLKSLNSPLFPPLSPDALSKWGTIGGHVHNANVKRATQYLLRNRVRDLISFLETHPVAWTRICVIVQEWGISIRHLGLMRAVCREERNQCILFLAATTTITTATTATTTTTTSPTTTTTTATTTATATATATDNNNSNSVLSFRLERLQDIEQQLLLCMVARSGKNLLRQELRQALLSKNVKQAIIEFFNSLTRIDTNEHESFWCVKLPSDLLGRFGHVCIVEKEESNLSRMCHSYISSIVYYICSTTGIVLRPNMEWKSIGTLDFEFTSEMIQELCCRTKTLDFFEKFLLEDVICMMCESKSASEFVRFTIQLSQKKMPSLQLLETVEAIVPPHNVSFALESLAELLKNKASPLPTIDLQCLTIRVLSLFFSGHIAGLRTIISHSISLLESACFALVRSVPQVFTQIDRELLFTEALIKVCCGGGGSGSGGEASTESFVTTLLAGKANANARDPQTGESVLKVLTSKHNSSGSSSGSSSDENGSFSSIIQLLLNARADPNLPPSSSSSSSLFASTQPTTSSFSPFATQQDTAIADEALPSFIPSNRKGPSVVTQFEAAKMKFERATQATRLFRNVSEERKLVLYGLYKQAVSGDVQGVQPEKVSVKEALPGSYVETIQYEAWAKWNAWNSVKGMSKEAAMEAYALEVEKQKVSEANPSSMRRPAPPPPASRPRADSTGPS